MYVATLLFDVLFSLRECPHCSKAIRKKAIRCPRCGSFLTDEQSQEELNAEPYARVKALVVEQTGALEKKINPDARLEDDLGITGDDGYELLEAFCEEFEIQNICEIDPSEYFAPEGCNPFEVYVLLYHLIFDREELNDSCTPLTLRDLVKSAEAKRWILPAVK